MLSLQAFLIICGAAFLVSSAFAIYYISAHGPRRLATLLGLFAVLSVVAYLACLFILDRHTLTSDRALPRCIVIAMTLSTIYSWVVIKLRRRADARQPLNEV